MRLLPSSMLLLALLGGCDMLGLESASAIAEKRLAEGKAVGAACRHAGRAIEDCYTLNRRTDKAAIYAGWREMDDYMRENKLSPVPPQLTPAAPAAAHDGEADAASQPPKGDDGKGDGEKDDKPEPAKSTESH